MADENLAKFGKSLWAAFFAVCINAFVCLVIKSVWQTIVLSRGLTGSYYNTDNYAGLAVLLILSGLVLASVIGLPTQMVMQRFGYTAWYWHNIPSACVVAALVCLLTTLTHYQRHPMLAWGIGFGLGFLGGTSFWLIRRPDKDEVVS